MYTHIYFQYPDDNLVSSSSLKDSIACTADPSALGIFDIFSVPR